MLQIKLKRITKRSIMVANILPADPSLTLGMKSVGQNLTFSEHGHVANQIKVNREMQQHDSKFFARRPPPTTTLGNGVKIQLFQNNVLMHIKLKGITNPATW